MNCDDCKAYPSECNGLLTLVPKYAAGSVRCEKFTPKLKTVDPAATCVDCGHYEPTETRCKQHGWFKNPSDIACVKIDAKKPTAERLKAEDCQFRAWNEDAGVTACERAASHVRCPIVGDAGACNDAEPKQPTV